MLVTKHINNIIEIIKKYENIEYRIINNTIGKNLILLSIENRDLIKELKEYDSEDRYIQEIIIENDEEQFYIEEMKDLCPKNSFVHRNISYISWNRKSKIKKVPNIISGYSFKGGMGRSTTLAYLAYFYYMMGKKIVVLDCDFEAPGISNLFFKKETRKTKSGILDYLIDLNIDNDIDLSNYYLKDISSEGGELSLFSTGIDSEINNYLNKISKIDFNSQSYTDKFMKLIKHINSSLKPDLIFIDLRAGINESNGFFLKHLSNMNFLFFNSEEQNENGLQVILNSLENNLKNSYIANSTIRYNTTKQDIIKSKEDEFLDFIDTVNSKIKTIPIKYKLEMLETQINNFKVFIDKEYKSFLSGNDIYLQKFIDIISNKYSFSTIEVEELEIDADIDMKVILEKLKEQFSKLIANQQFNSEDDLKYFYFKDDIQKLINEQIFLILGAKGTGKSSLFEIFTKNYNSLLNNINMENNRYIAGFSENISDNVIGKDYLKIVLDKSNNTIEDIERFWKFLTLYQIEEYKSEPNPYFKDISKIKDNFMNLEIALEVDKRLKDINIELLKSDEFITLVYDELDVRLTEKRVNFIDGLVEFWRSSRNKLTQIKSKILLRNDIFYNLEIENKTHLELNTDELKWTKYEILSLILNIIINTLTEKELSAVGLLDIVDKNNKLIKDKDKIIQAIYKIFGEKINENRSNISTMDNWIITYLSDGDGIVTPRVIYKFMSESIKKELEYLDNQEYKVLLPNLNENINDILYEVSSSKMIEYDEEYKGYNKYYERIKKIGYRIFEKQEFKETFKKGTKLETKEDEFKKLLDSGFIILKDKDKNPDTYQVANVYVPKLDIKMNRQGRRKQ